MYFLVKDILDKNLLEGAELKAGKRGLNNPASWVIFMEILDALDSLQSGEILVTTGYKLDDSERYQDFIMRLKSRGISAVIIQTGYYIDKIPEHVLNEADRYNIPVIEIPAKVTFSAIMHILIDYINLKRDTRDDAVIIDLKNKAAKMAGDKEIGFDKKQEFSSYFFLLSLSASNAAEMQKNLAISTEKIKSFFMVKSSCVEMELCSDKALYYLKLNKSSNIHDLIFDLNNLITAISRSDHINIWIGASTIDKPDNIGVAFDQAFSACKALYDINAKKGVCHYENLRFFEWFENFHDKSNALSFAYDILKPIINYDYFHNSEYFKTLQLYLANDCKISETSEKLFVHRHTLKNRLDKISRLCSADFEDYFTKLHFSLAMLVYEYFMS